jgi:putative ABC transport system substrate-binding protein
VAQARELLKEVVPKLGRVAVLGTSTSPRTAPSLKEAELAARAFGVKLQFLDVLGPKDIETAFQAAGKGRSEAVRTLGSPVLNAQRKQIVDLALKSRLPAIYPQTEYTEAGGLMYYGVNTPDRQYGCIAKVAKLVFCRWPTRQK